MRDGVARCLEPAPMMVSPALEECGHEVLQLCIIAGVHDIMARRPPVQPGHREVKKQRTRQALIDAARRLYLEKGLEGTTVAEIARLADVAPRTFFTYFETKEDVFLGPGDARIDRLVEAIQQRRPGQPILAALREGLGAGRPPAATEAAPGVAELLSHPAIEARLRERWNQWEDRLARAIAEEVAARPGDPAPRVVAAALTGAIRVAAEEARRHPRQGRGILGRAFDVLEGGLSDYGAQGD
jgi:AcrR family transcriptional regulator